MKYYIDGMRIEEEEFYELLQNNSKKSYGYNFNQLEYYGSIQVNGIEFSMSEEDKGEEEIWFHDYN